MRVLTVVVSLLLGAATAGLSSAPAEWIAVYRPVSDRLIAASLANDFAWQRLATLTDTFGPRLSGTDNLERAIRWAEGQMRADGLDNVRLQHVTVPHWVRGDERVEIVEPTPSPLAMLGLGGSVATPPGGLTAEALVVDSFDALKVRAREARGRIVVFNVPFADYRRTVVYRTNGASEAARVGAVAALVRSVGPMGMRTPHTGMMVYADSAPRIPAAAIAAEDAERLQRLQDRGVRTVLRLTMSARALGERPSANVIGEVTGRERASEIVLVGGHFDSWDVGTGASDDGVGCVIAWEALRLLKKIDVRPRRTVRAVLFTNEENGLRGGLEYASAFAAEAAQHVLAVEADLGAFAPLRIGFSGPDRGRTQMTDIAALLAGLGISGVEASGGGADIGPIARTGSVPMVSIGGDPERYFAVHHTHADTVDRITPEEVSRAAGAMAVVAYVAAEMPERIGQPEGSR
jgi:carboxypeptidase Q